VGQVCLPQSASFCAGFLQILTPLLTRYLNITEDGEPYLSLQLLLGYICYPIAFLIGIPRADLRQVGELIGIKVITNEYVAFKALTTEARYLAMSPRSQTIATYALCGELSPKHRKIF
jgi:concentrative nucleoside transporter, CNT family